MKKIALSLVVAYGLSLSVISSAGAQQKEEPQAPEALYQQCQDLLRKEPDSKEAKQLCNEGMKQYQEGST